MESVEEQNACRNMNSKDCASEDSKKVSNLELRLETEFRCDRLVYLAEENSRRHRI